jgi:membrane fusion protein, copper/silver efflux system
MSASAGGGMASGAAPAPSGSLPPPDSRLTTTEGAYVTAGQSVFRVVNTERIWATFPVYAGQLPGLHLGTPLGIRAESQPDSLLTGKVDFIEPIYRQGRQTATIRAYLNNPGGTLRSGMLLRGEISFRVDTGLWLPRGAVLDLGNRSVAFRKESNTLRPVGVVTGFKTDEWVQIISGLSQVDAVAAHAQQLMDSEAFVLVNQPQP